MDVFYRFGSTNSSDAGAYTLSATVPTELATTTFSSVNKYKTSTTTVEAGAVLSSGTKGARLSRILAYVTYTPLTAPSNLNSSSTSTTIPAKINLSWTKPGTIEEKFALERSTDSLNWFQISTTSSSVSTTTDSGLTSGTYYYRIRSYDFGGYSSYSNVSSTTIP
jgi:titin